MLVAQNTRVGVNIWPQGPAPHGSSPQVWADIDPVKTEGVQCTWNQSTGAIGCVSPTGAVQFSVDGQPVGDPVSVVPSYVSPCPLVLCPFVFGDNRVYAPAVVMRALNAAAARSTR